MSVKLTAEQAALCQQINSANEPNKPPFLPVDDKQFIQCSNAIKRLIPNPYEHRDTPSRVLPLPSCVLPPPV